MANYVYTLTVSTDQRVTFVRHYGGQRKALNGMFDAVWDRLGKETKESVEVFVCDIRDALRHGHVWELRLKDYLTGTVFWFKLDTNLLH